MKALYLATLLSIGLFAPAFAQGETGGSTGDKAQSPTTTTQPAGKPVNTKCPVGGDAIDPNVTIEYDGKIIAFCCADCIDMFKKNPEKYMKKLK